MLSVTDAAAAMIDQLVDEAGAAAAAGLRLTHEQGSHALLMGLTDHPERDDEVLAVPGAHAPVYLDPEVVARVGNAVLDVKREPGAAAFFLRED